MDKLKLVGRIFSTAAKLITIPVLILVFLERDVIIGISDFVMNFGHQIDDTIKGQVKKFNSGSLSDISDRIFNNGIEAIKSIENGANHVD